MADSMYYEVMNASENSQARDQKTTKQVQRRRLCVIVNLDSGSTSAQGVATIKQYTSKQQDRARIHKVKKVSEAIKIISTMKRSSYDAVAIYGGDGTSLAVLKAASKHELPVLLLPGGTANILAADLGLPTTIEESLMMYYSGAYILRQVDIAQANRSDFVLDLHFGAWAKAVSSASARTKQLYGKLAYAVSAARELRSSKRYIYDLRLDDRRIRVPAHALMIANGGLQNVLGLPLFPSPHGRGMLQIAIVKSVSPPHLFIWYFLRSMGVRRVPQVISTYTARNVLIRRAPKQMIFDDHMTDAKLPLTIQNTGRGAKLISPAKSVQRTIFDRAMLRIRLTLYRWYERTLRRIMGVSVGQYSHVGPYLYVGGQYRASARRYFERLGIKAIVNLRRQRIPRAVGSIKILHVPTQDWRPPTLDGLKRGIRFIDSHVSKKQAVYVHCRLGEGRGPTMAAAYLISKGMTAEEAVAHIQRFRPMARPNRMQMRQLARLQEELHRADNGDV